MAFGSIDHFVYIVIQTLQKEIRTGLEEIESSPSQEMICLFNIFS
jgi:hypothetical protein